MRKYILITILVLVCLSNYSSVNAQENPGQAFYIVQRGDTLGGIAVRFGVTIESLINANKLANPNAIAVGMQLIIPGLDGIKGILKTETVSFGENLLSLSMRGNIPINTLVRLNRITSPEEVYTGSQMVTIQSDKKELPQPVVVLEAQQTLLEAAITNNTSTWAFMETHHSRTSHEFVPSSMLYLPAARDTQKSSPATSCLMTIQINPLPLSQGQTAVIRVNSSSEDTITGSLGSYPLAFYADGERSFVALQGIHAMTEPGLIPITMKCIRSGRVIKEISQMVIIRSGYYPDEKLIVEPATIDVVVTKPEDDFVNKLVGKNTDKKLWKSAFRQPVDQPVCYRSGFGNRRSYNNGVLLSFHAGVDYGVCANLNVYAPAPGIVVFAGPLTVRGNTIYIDHGWGVFSGYFHLKELKSAAGNRVEPGQLIGLIGATGRVTGPHLHWEIWANQAQVNPLTWLDKYFP